MILFEDSLVSPKILFSTAPDFQVVHHVGEPLGADLNKSPPSIWKPLWQPGHNNTGEQVDRPELELREAGAPAKDVEHLQVSLRGVHTDWHPQSACLFIYRKKVWICG